MKMQFGFVGIGLLVCFTVARVHGQQGNELPWKKYWQFLLESGSGFGCCSWARNNLAEAVQVSYDFFGSLKGW